MQLHQNSVTTFTSGLFQTMQHYTMPKVSNSIILESEDGWHTQEKQYHTKKHDPYNGRVKSLS